ncbi:peptidoglycan-binding domain-containing protein [Neorhizobium alkalisoli]|uniref:Putative peptidoglycan binding protein n=1 Tax=Neorhizobium alkalisoli TaxID=528178 RepID=A0A561QWK2_9HYPH|nr:peptidoglycan-binding domain-containing protein [Neorhizobium alkalisoli]TWF54722.1 putative peptidoglycan binding protein [Neorhizobium alkalisoli]
MAARKRKSPDKRRPAKKPGLASTMLVTTGGVFARTISRNPKAVFGFAGFAVLFSFVAANALWYQPGGHPSPFLATRDPEHPNALTGYRRPAQVHPDDVTTFRIERASDKPADKPAAPAQVVQAAPPAVVPPAANQPAAALPQPPALANAATPSADSAHVLIAAVQHELARRGLYDGAEDGVTGPRTQSAILFFEESAGLAQTGEASAELLAALKAEPRPAAAPAVAQRPQIAPQPLPKPAAEVAKSQPRPAPVPQPARPIPVSVKAEDPVAAAIRDAERKPSMIPPANIPTGNIPAAASRPGTQVASRSPVPATNMVLQIQRGLSNIAYSDVEIDGVAGLQTKEAIRRFERHYRLPETGEPNPMVLNKLKAIGAL